MKFLLMKSMRSWGDTCTLTSLRPPFCTRCSGVQRSTHGPTGSPRSNAGSRALTTSRLKCSAVHCCTTRTGLLWPRPRASPSSGADEPGPSPGCCSAGGSPQDSAAPSIAHMHIQTNHPAARLRKPSSPRSLSCSPAGLRAPSATASYPTLLPWHRSHVAATPPPLQPAPTPAVAPSPPPPPRLFLEGSHSSHDYA